MSVILHQWYVSFLPSPTPSLTIVSQIRQHHHSQSDITGGLFLLRSSHIKLAPGTVAIMSTLTVFPSTTGLPLMKCTCNKRGAVMLTCVCRVEKYTGDRNTLSIMVAMRLAIFGDQQSLGSSNLWGPAIFGAQQSLGPSNLWGPAIFGAQQSLGPL